MKIEVKVKKLISFLLFLSILFSGCATILHGLDDSVYLGTQPEGADIYINGFDRGKTPSSIMMGKNKFQIVEFRLEGYQNKIIPVERNIQAGWVVLDILCGIIPLIVDGLDGAWYDLQPISIYLDRINK